MSYDLTNKNISDTFQNLLQRTGSDNQLYDLNGNLVDNLTIVGDISASGNINASDLELSGNINASSLEVISTDPTEDFFLLKSGSLNALKLNNEGVLQLGGFTFTPTAVSGGFYYNDDHY